MRSQELENFIEYCNFQETGNTKVDDRVNHSRTPIPILRIFYNMCEGTYPDDMDGSIYPPEQDEFVEEAYSTCKKYAEGDDSKMFTEEFRDSWESRFSKAWVSFIREIHFSFLIQDNYDYDDITYRLEDDLNGVDLQISSESNKYLINIFINTKKSERFLSTKKKSRHNIDGTDIYVPLNPGGIKTEIKTRKDTVWLYHQKHAEAVDKIITEDEEQVWFENEKICYVKY